MRLNLGCGKMHWKGYVNVDQCSLPGVITDDIVTLVKLKQGDCEIIRSHHALEHLSFEDATLALKRWVELLAPGGLLQIETPDFVQSALEFASSRGDMNRVPLEHYPVLQRLAQVGDWGIYTGWGRMRNFFGAQDNEGQFHKSGWWLERLTLEFVRLGLVKVTGRRSIDFELSEVFDSSRGGAYYKGFRGEEQYDFTCHAGEEPVISVEGYKPT